MTAAAAKAAKAAAEAAVKALELEFRQASTEAEAAVKVQGRNQALSMTSERFMTPEVLFSPGLVGLEQGGVAEAVAAAIAACPKDLQGAMYGSVLVVGGNARIPGYSSRLERELRAVTPDAYRLQIHQSDDPVVTAWRGGAIFASKSTFSQVVVSKADYDEQGHNVCARAFHN